MMALGVLVRKRLLGEAEQTIAVCIDRDPLDLVLRLTLLLVVFHGAAYPENVLVRPLAGAALVVPGLLRSRWVWLSLSAILLIADVRHWTVLDNHKYLISYWTLACAIALRDGRPSSLSEVARVMVGVVFVAAVVVWKLATGAYLSGSYWYYLVHANFSELLMGPADVGVSGVRLAVLALGQVGSPGDSLQLAADHALWTLARVISWSGLLLELIVGDSLCPDLRAGPLCDTARSSPSRRSLIPCCPYLASRPCS